MKNITCIVITLLCFASCRNIKQNTVTEPDNQVKPEVLDKQIQDALMLFIDDLDAINFVLDRVYTVEFFNKGTSFVFTYKDSAVIISSLNCSVELVGYKGIISFNNYAVAIIDEDNIGLNYYDTVSLCKIPLNLLKCLNEELRAGSTYIIKNGILKEWRPPERNMQQRRKNKQQRPVTIYLYPPSSKKGVPQPTISNLPTMVRAEESKNSWAAKRRVTTWTALKPAVIPPSYSPIMAVCVATALLPRGRAIIF